MSTKKRYNSKKHYCSKLTFNDLTNYLSFIQVYWNNQLVYDDTAEDLNNLSYDSLRLNYGDKIVYSIHIDVVDFHHCILKVTGEE